MPTELNGMVVVDKPEGLSSARVVSRVKALFGARKVGHTGTLDPFATGVLICTLNRATRLSQFFLKGDKAYEAVLRLGVTTDTQDGTGTVVERCEPAGITAAMIEAAAEGFRGAILQVPPVYSALKHKGTPLYKLARRGQAVEKPARSVQIYRLEIIDVQLPDVRLAVTCSSGTYIRTLCADMGARLGCGGHLAVLRRTASCGIGVDSAIGLDALEALHGQQGLADRVVPMNSALHFLPALQADEVLDRKVRHGMPIFPDDFAATPAMSPQGLFKVVDSQDNLLAVVRKSPDSDDYNYCCVFSS